MAGFVFRHENLFTVSLHKIDSGYYLNLYLCHFLQNKKNIQIEFQVHQSVFDKLHNET